MLCTIQVLIPGWDSKDEVGVRYKLPKYLCTDPVTGEKRDAWQLAPLEAPPSSSPASVQAGLKQQGCRPDLDNFKEHPELMSRKKKSHIRFKRHPIRFNRALQSNSSWLANGRQQKQPSAK